MNLFWVSINCRHEGFDDLADELLERTDEGTWWLCNDCLESMIGRPTRRGILCLVIIITLMV
jgi:hypothetical protein